MRGVKKGNKWHPARDHLAGKEVYGSINDTDENFSIRFDNIKYNQVCLIEFLSLYFTYNFI